ncbi:uncharacterized protein N7483_002745 [Penicillium malachiteum]|uniref:uncharacterized protein n=1 Tax=Penicillium malachiteum TaxID=1324776 RepID=UPI0025482937|nr:uncharacterized protein N7483_002745 [Penicillium malachiteum]KAJ5737620.1 hypothetical protein N7483_002745 [Penicillium malachiteum]
MEEVAAMQMARAAGMPVPKVLSCGEHPNEPYNRLWSILMTRLPGIQLENSYDSLHVELEEPWLLELKTCLTSMREWTSPYDRRICSVINMPMRSARVPDHTMGPLANDTEFHEFLISPASGHGFDTTEKYLEARVQANNIRKFQHRITFTHGDTRLTIFLSETMAIFPGFSTGSQLDGYLSIGTIQLL